MGTIDLLYLNKVLNLNLNHKTQYFIIQGYFIIQFINSKHDIIKQIQFTEFIRTLIIIQSSKVFYRYLFNQDQIQIIKITFQPFTDIRKPQYTSTNPTVNFPSLPLQIPTTPLLHSLPQTNPQTIPYLPTSYSNIPFTHFITKTTPIHQIMNLTQLSQEDGLQISSWIYDFYNIQKKENPITMTQTVPIKSFDSEIIYDSDESAQVKRLEDQFLDQVLEKDMDQDSQTRIKREVRTRPIAKKDHHYVERAQIHRPSSPQERKKRNNSKSGKWSGANRNNYYKAILKFSTEHPYYTVSWRYWKPEKFYPKMIEQINKNELYYKKDVIQTKSFDQRQRKEFFDKEPKWDMLELALMRVKDMQCIDLQATEILKNYEAKLKEKSQHMRMLDEVMMKANEKKYQLEDLYAKITGAARLPIEECANSVFYS